MTCGSAMARSRAARAAASQPSAGSPLPAAPHEGRWGSMQVIWMVMVTLVLALSGVLALALMTHLAAWTRRR